MGDIMLLEEDPTYEPTTREIKLHAKWAGLDLELEKDLLWVIKEALTTSCGKRWMPCQTAAGEVFYFNTGNGQSSWDHPGDEAFWKKLASEREKLRASGRTDLPKVNLNEDMRPIGAGLDHRPKLGNLRPLATSPKTGGHGVKPPPARNNTGAASGAAKPPPKDPIKIMLEHCVDCPSHKWCTRHKVEKYADMASLVENTIYTTFPGSEVEINSVEWLRRETKTTKPRVGSFEIHVTKGYVKRKIFSKLETNKWPNVDKLTNKLREVLLQLGGKVQPAETEQDITGEEGDSEPGGHGGHGQGGEQGGGSPRKGDGEHNSDHMHVDASRLTPSEVAELRAELAAEDGGGHAEGAEEQGKGHHYSRLRPTSAMPKKAAPPAPAAAATGSGEEGEPSLERRGSAVWVTSEEGSMRENMEKVVIDTEGHFHMFKQMEPEGEAAQDGDGHGSEKHED